jgi:hypothetical protein
VIDKKSIVALGAADLNYKSDKFPLQLPMMEK